MGVSKWAVMVTVRGDDATVGGWACVNFALGAPFDGFLHFQVELRAGKGGGLY